MFEIKLSYVLLLVFAILIFYSNNSNLLHIQNRDTNLQSPVLKLINENNGKGSAVHIGNGLVLTAAHNLSSRNIHLYTDSQQKLSNRLLWVARDYDIALIKIDVIDNLDSFKINCNPLSVGNNMYFLGHPLNLDFVKLTGTVIKVQIQDLSPTWKSLVAVQAPIVPGMSGGAAIGKNNILEGIIVGAMTFNQSMTGKGYIVPGKTLCMLLAKERK